MGEELFDKICLKFESKWNLDKERISNFIEQDDKDRNSYFKWAHLVYQEIRMWIKLSVRDGQFIRENNQEDRKFIPGQVNQIDFDCIVTRRGFNNDQVEYILESLKWLGIGNNLKNNIKME